MKIQKIMLIQPGIRRPWANFSQPLGLLYLVSVLRRDFPGQFEVELVEQALYGLDLKRMRERIRAFMPDLIGFSCTSLEAPEMEQLARISRELDPQCLTVLGGPHAKFFYDQVLENPDIDVAVLGEGELTFPELMRKLMAAQPLDDVKGIAFKKNGRIILTPPRETIYDLDALPFPAWDLVDFNRYAKVLSMNAHNYASPWAVILTSRGCPFHCAYCHDILGRRQD